MLNRNILLLESIQRGKSSLYQSLSGAGYRIHVSHSVEKAIEKSKTQRFPLVIADLEISGDNVIKLLNSLKSENKNTHVLVTAMHASVKTAVDVMKAGALDYLVKPIDYAQIQCIIEKVFKQNRNKNISSIQQNRSTRIVTQNYAMQNLLELAKQIADSKATVLIQGESGTGKELFARFIHENSPQKNGPFIAVNCGALPEMLLESELFGHEKGSFTGAFSRKPGKFELANNGTILLDEITEMKMHLQAKLLRVLQEHEIDTLGGLHPVNVNIRVIATTNKNMKATVEKGEFREDLFYRLNVIPLTIPPLRNRTDDILFLSQHFIEKYNSIDGRNVKCLTKKAAKRLLNHQFKGNVRELENIIERAVILSKNLSISEKDFLLENSSDADEQTLNCQCESLTGPLKNIEKKIIFNTLDKANGNRTHAAKTLGISVRTLRNKLNDYKNR